MNKIMTTHEFTHKCNFVAPYDLTKIGRLHALTGDRDK